MTQKSGHVAAMSSASAPSAKAISADAASAPFPGKLVHLFEIDIKPVPFRFIAEAVRDGMVRFANAEYRSFPIMASGFAWSAEGPPARPILEVSNVTGLFNDAVTRDQLRGIAVRRIMTLTSELDPPHGEGGGNCFPVERWVIDRIARLEHSVMRLELCAEASLEGKQFPQRVMLRDLCQHIYRRWDSSKAAFDYAGVTCPYQGDRYFTADGDETADPAKDECSLHLMSGCRKRFSFNLPFLGFPGVRRL